jgi:hypothetical protein
MEMLKSRGFSRESRTSRKQNGAFRFLPVRRSFVSSFTYTAGPYFIFLRGVRFPLWRRLNFAQRGRYTATDEIRQRNKRQAVTKKPSAGGARKVVGRGDVGLRLLEKLVNIHDQADGKVP